MSAKDLINWGALSRRLSGSRQTVRKNSIPLKHQPLIDDLLEAIDSVFMKHEKTKDSKDEK
jgi:hypothetical protein